MEYKKTILIVDDMKHIRDILWFTLKKEGYKPVLADSGPEGLNILLNEDTHIDLVVLDVMMPKVDGFEVLEVIRSHKGDISKIPVIMLTAKAQKDDVVKGLKMGASDYILKPYKFKDLLSKIKVLIG
ncbi:MAG: DNA-binding response regulator [Desulfobacteraceae bacterium]|nr:MAG: DNA-binding response regulator [Desulfobacteraceae bacterium]